MNNMDLIRQMPEMLSGQELYEKLADIPAYSEEIRGKSQTERLINLSAIYEIYLPSEMSIEIYSKLYLAVRGSGYLEIHMCARQSLRRMVFIGLVKRRCGFGTTQKNR